MTSVARLRKDYTRLKKDPIPYIDAEPCQNNILRWHYVVTGPEKTPYAGGIYMGTLVFPSDYPFRPPSIYIVTPNGRFSTQTRLCLSISDYHPDTWNPAWSVSTILTGLLSFMLDSHEQTYGSIDTSDEKKRQLAKESPNFNLADPVFCELFPDHVAVCKRKVRERHRKEQDALQRLQIAAQNVKADSQESEENDCKTTRYPPTATSWCVALFQEMLNRLSIAVENVVSSSHFANAIILGLFAVFAFIIQFVVQDGFTASMSEKSALHDN